MMRALRPDRMTYAVQGFVEEKLGQIVHMFEKHMALLLPQTQRLRDCIHIGPRERRGVRAIRHD